MLRSMAKDKPDSPPQPSSLVHWLVRRLETRIVEGSYAEGERLPEVQLAVEFGVSRAPVREAFRVLAHEGLITLSPRRGAVVSTYDAKTVNDIYQCRVQLAPLSASIATRNLTRGDLAQLRRLMSRMEASVADNNPVEYFRLNVKFNEYIGSHNTNQVLRDLYASLGKRVTRLRYLSMTLPGRARRSLEGNRQMLEAMEAGDADAAGRIAAQVIDEARVALVEHLHQNTRQAQIA